MQRKESLTRIHSLVRLGALAAAVALAPQAADADRPTVETRGSSTRVHQATKLATLDPVLHQLLVPTGAAQLKVTSIVRLFPVDPDLFGVRRVKKAQGRTTIVGWAPERQQVLGSSTRKFGPNGNLATARAIGGVDAFDWILVDFEFLRRFELPAGTSVSVSTAIETVKPNADPDCFDATTLCLNDDRFKVEVGWRDFAGNSGAGVAFPRSDDSGLFFFFDPNNWEMLAKVIDGCDFNDHFWVFAAATTDVEYELTVTDTMSGESRVYGNSLGNPAPAITDTQAFATCP